MDLTCKKNPLKYQKNKKLACLMLIKIDMDDPKADSNELMKIENRYRFLYHKLEFLEKKFYSPTLSQSPFFCYFRQKFEQFYKPFRNFIG